jgi:hypothetical protein
MIYLYWVETYVAHVLTSLILIFHVSEWKNYVLLSRTILCNFHHLNSESKYSRLKKLAAKPKTQIAISNNQDNKG